MSYLSLGYPKSMVEHQFILEAAAALERGELVAFPTETVYGLGADAGNAEALRSLYRLKGRPASHPSIVHLQGAEDMELWSSAVPDAAWLLADAFWPGPLTLVLPKAACVLDELTGGQTTVAIRVPAHELAQELLTFFGRGIAAPSANKFGRVSPTCADDVRREFSSDLALIIDGGQCQVGIESTIVDLSGGEPRILRPGMISESSILAVLSGKTVAEPIEVSSTSIQSPRVPGALLSHYAPGCLLQLVEASSLAAKIQSVLEEGKRPSLMIFPRSAEALTSILVPGIIKHLICSENPEQYARDLYRQVRLLDSPDTDLILVERPPQSEAWTAIQDRLSKAAGQRFRFEQEGIDV